MIEELTNIDKLRSIGQDQYGYVTASQARDAGISKPALSMLVKRDRIEKVAHGVYRVPQIPTTEHDKYMLAVLWTGTDNAVISHQTALDLYDISDINPITIDLTIEKGRRITRQGGNGYSIHFEKIEPGDISWWEGIPIVSVKKALEQCIDEGVPTYLLEQAIDNSSKRGMVLKQEAAGLRNKLKERDAKANHGQQ